LIAFNYPGLKPGVKETKARQPGAKLIKEKSHPPAETYLEEQNSENLSWIKN
jgi:hypothetical protein